MKTARYMLHMPQAQKTFQHVKPLLYTPLQPHQLQPVEHHVSSKLAISKTFEPISTRTNRTKRASETFKATQQGLSIINKQPTYYRASHATNAKKFQSRSLREIA